MSGNVCVIGSINVDLVVNADRLPMPGETVLGGTFTIHDGGKGANAAVAAARAGATVTFIGAVGRDGHGERALAALSAEGIATERIRQDERYPTGVALITFGPRGENQITVAPGANGTVELDDVDRALITAADIVLTNHEMSTRVVTDVLRACATAGVTAILNPAPARALSADLLRLGPILTPNEHELVVAIGNDVTGSALDELAARNAGPIIVTQGPAGALLIRDGERTRVPGHSVPAVVDTTGAGDTFNGVLAAWLAHGAELPEAVEAANAAASLSVTAAGARDGMPTGEAIRKLLTLV